MPCARAPPAVPRLHFVHSALLPCWPPVLLGVLFRAVGSAAQTRPAFALAPEVSAPLLGLGLVFVLDLSWICLGPVLDLLSLSSSCPAIHLALNLYPSLDPVRIHRWIRLYPGFDLSCRGFVLLVSPSPSSPPRSSPSSRPRKPLLSASDCHSTPPSVGRLIACRLHPPITTCVGSANSPCKDRTPVSVRPLASLPFSRTPISPRLPPAFVRAPLAISLTMQIDDSLRPHLAPSNDCFALPPSSFQPQFLVPVPNSQKDIAADLGKSISPPSQEPRLSRSYESAASARTLSSSGTTLVSAPSAKFDATFHIADYVTYVIHRIWFPTKPAVELPGKLVHTIHRLITIPNVPEASPHHINFSLHLLTRLKQLKPSATFTAKLFLIALIVSHKFLTDLTLRNSSWAKRANVHVDEINRGEMAFLADLNYNLFGEPHFYQSWLLTLRSLKEDWMIERLSPHRQLSIRSASTPLFTTPPAPVSSRSYPPPIPVTSGAASSSTGFLLPPSATRVITASPGEVAVSPGEIAVSPAAISPGESSAANPSHSMQSTLSVPSIAIPAIQVTVPLNSINPDVDMSFYPKPDLAFTKSDSDTTLLPPSPARTASSTTTGGGNSDLATMMDLEMEEPTPKVPRRFFTVQ